MSSSSSGHSPISITMTSTRTTPSSHQSNPLLPISIVNNSTSIAQVPNYESIPQRNVGAFPCSNPINPHMRDRENRLQTFVDRATNWPAHRINATPREIVDAGFFYLGNTKLLKIF